LCECKLEHTPKAHKNLVDHRAANSDKGKNGKPKTGVRAVTTNDTTNEQTTTTNPPTEQTVNIPQPVWQEMQNNLRKIKDCDYHYNNTNKVSQNCRVHIFNSKTDGIMQNYDQNVKISNINKMKSKVQCSNTLDNDILNYVNLRLKMLNEEKKRKTNDIMQIKKYIINDKKQTRIQTQ
jgi:hypothetical protein